MKPFRHTLALMAAALLAVNVYSCHADEPAQEEAVKSVPPEVKFDPAFTKKMREDDHSYNTGAGTFFPYQEASTDYTKAMSAILYIVVEGPLGNERMTWVQSRLMILQTFQNAMLIEQNKRIIELLEAQAKK
jgi:hypothetical protein